MICNPGVDQLNQVNEGGHFLKPIKHSRKRSRKLIPTIPEKWKKEFDKLTLKPRTLKITLLNPYITCRVCQGYLVDATTITECLHSFCRSCIVKHFESIKTNYTCPLCHELVHKTNPWYNLKTDCVLQDIVDKLVPNFSKAEERRRKVFYISRGLPVPEKVIKPDVPKPPANHHNERPKAKVPRPRAPVASPTRESESKAPGDNTTEYPTEHCCEDGDDEITMQLEMRSVDELTIEGIEPLKRKFVRCSNRVTIGLLQTFLARKLKLEAANQIEIICNDMELGTDFTLNFIKETISEEEDHSKPLLLFYGLSDMA